MMIDLHPSIPLSSVYDKELEFRKEAALRAAEASQTTLPPFPASDNRIQI
jgi:hypothetical protein